MRIDSGFVEPFDFAAVGARSPTSRARVLEVRIQSPPAVSLRTIVVTTVRGSAPSRIPNISMSQASG